MTDRVEEGGIVMRLTVAHVPEIARIHAAAFPDSTVTRLGSRVVEQYYRWQFEAPHEMNALGVYVGSELVGFCLSGVFRGAVSGFLRRNRGTILWAAVRRPFVFGNARALRNVLVVMTNWFRLAPAASLPPTDPPRTYSVLSIATDPTRRGRGYGRQLMLDAADRARSGGFTCMQLTVQPSNARAVSFYEALGWQRVTERGVWRGKMIRFTPPEAT